MSDEAVTMDISDVVAEETPQEPPVSEEVTDAPEEEEEAPDEEAPEEDAPEEEEEAPEEDAPEEDAPEEDAPEEDAPEPEEAPEEEEEEEEAPEEDAPEEEEEAPEESSSPEPEEEQVEETPVEETPVDPVPVEQVASDIREILAPVESANEVEKSSSSSELTEDLKQRIAELDYLRECCGNWVYGRISRNDLFHLWDNKSIIICNDVIYEDKLTQLEKIPELIKKWINKSINFQIKNYFENINDYKLEKPFFEEGYNQVNKIEKLEKIINLILNISIRKFNKYIDALY